MSLERPRSTTPTSARPSLVASLKRGGSLRIGKQLNRFDGLKPLSKLVRLKHESSVPAASHRRQISAPLDGTFVHEPRAPLSTHNVHHPIGLEVEESWINLPDQLSPSDIDPRFLSAPDATTNIKDTNDEEQSYTREYVSDSAVDGKRGRLVPPKPLRSAPAIPTTTNLSEGPDGSEADALQEEEFRRAASMERTHNYIRELERIKTPTLSRPPSMPPTNLEIPVVHVEAALDGEDVDSPVFDPIEQVQRLRGYSSEHATDSNHKLLPPKPPPKDEKWSRLLDSAPSVAPSIEATEVKGSPSSTSAELDPLSLLDVTTGHQTTANTSGLDEWSETSSESPLLEELLRSRPPQDLTGQVSIDSDAHYVEGGFARVWQGMWNGEKVAVKETRIKVPAHWRRSLKRRVDREIRVWAALSHENILEFLGFADDYGEFPAPISPWCKNGTAEDFLQGDVTINIRLLLAHDVTKGLQYLHGLNVIHGDLKPRNVLINDRGIAVLCDFGLVALDDWRGLAGMTTTSTYQATRLYMAPEFSNRQSYGVTKATLMGDIYALGCLIFEFTEGQTPYSHLYDFPRELERALRTEEYPARRPSQECDDFATRFWNLLEDCWDGEPDFRPNASDVLKGLETLLNLLRGPSPSGTSISSFPMQESSLSTRTKDISTESSSVVSWMQSDSSEERRILDASPAESNLITPLEEQNYFVYNDSHDQAALVIDTPTRVETPTAKSFLKPERPFAWRM